MYKKTDHNQIMLLCLKKQFGDLIYTDCNKLCILFMLFKILNFC